MIVQLSSGQGPRECELAVCKLYEALKKQYPDVTILSANESGTKGCCTSIQFKTSQDLSELEGTVQWICQSPFRPAHKRKNWFVDVSILPKEDLSGRFGGEGLKASDLKWEYFHCGGKGGQNVNKVETGVRLIHLPTGILVTSTAERNQMANRRDALHKLERELCAREQSCQGQKRHDAWREHYEIVRGNPIRVYKGLSFKQIR